MGRPTKENSLTKQDVIAAAIACLEKEGESALGVNRVARELNIKPPAIYKHLEKNAGLRRAVARREETLPTPLRSHWGHPRRTLYKLSDDALIDVMRMVNAAIYGFITREQSELMTLSHSSDASYEVMLNALLVAIKHIKQVNP